jgi:hypothetical protein
MPIEPPGLVIQVTLSRSEKSTYSDIDLKGGYVMNGFGTLISQAPLLPGPFRVPSTRSVQRNLLGSV